MEQPGPRRLVRIALGGLALATGVLLVWAAGRPSPTAALADQPAAMSPGDGTILVEVRNGAGRDGLARQVTSLLRGRGVDVIYFGSAPAADSTVVLVRRGDVGRGREIAHLIGRGTVRWAPDSLLRVDVTVLLGTDYRLPADYQGL